MNDERGHKVCRCALASNVSCHLPKTMLQLDFSTHIKPLFITIFDWETCHVIFCSENNSFVSMWPTAITHILTSKNRILNYWPKSSWLNSWIAHCVAHSILSSSPTNVWLQWWLSRGQQVPHQRWIWGINWRLRRLWDPGSCHQNSKTEVSVAAQKIERKFI